MSRFYITKKNEFVWKKIKCNISYSRHDQYLVECMIPKGTRCYGTKTGKNRAEQIVPIAFYEHPNIGSHFSSSCLYVGCRLRLSKKKQLYHTGYFSAHPMTYTLGKVAKPHYFSDVSEECTGGIHFWWKPEKALNWR